VVALVYIPDGGSYFCFSIFNYIFFFFFYFSSAGALFDFSFYIGANYYGFDFYYTYNGGFLWDDVYACGFSFIDDGGM